jgi:hypothetical protein
MKYCHYLLMIATLLFGVAEISSAQTTMQPWLTHSADNSRSGWNPHETQLTQASVATEGITRATIIPLVGDARGMEAQPLILPNVKTALGPAMCSCCLRWPTLYAESTRMTAPAFGR